MEIPAELIGELIAPILEAFCLDPLFRWGEDYFGVEDCVEPLFRAWGEYWGIGEEDSCLEPLFRWSEEWMGEVEGRGGEE